MATTKTRVLGARLYPKVGVNWPMIWRNGAGAQDYWVPAGETLTSMVELCAASGVSIITLRLQSGDHTSSSPGWEVRPGEFNWAETAITRNGNGDITSPLHAWNDPVPANSNIKQIMDACYANHVKVHIQIEWNDGLKAGSHWNYHPYRLNRLNAADNIEGLGIAGWLVDPDDFWTNATAKAYYKRRVGCWLNAYGDHPAFHVMSLGSEIMFAGESDEADFFNWVDEMTQYIWDHYGARKPLITVSTADALDWAAESINDTFDYINGGSRLLTWHDYGSWHDGFTLIDIRDAIYTMMDDIGTYSFQPAYTGETRKFFVKVGENWGFRPGPAPVPDTITDINIQGDPVTHTLAYQIPQPDDTVTPYPHERMYGFLAMAIDPTMTYCRWPQYLDGKGGFPTTFERMAEIMEVCKDFYDTALFHHTDMVRQTGSVASDGVLDFKAALRLEDIIVTFVLVGAGNQTIDFGVVGNWTMVTYDWEGDGADSWQRIVNEVVVNGAATVVAFGDYTDGFCPGYLIKDTDYATPVATTITTEVQVVTVTAV